MFASTNMHMRIYERIHAYTPTLTHMHAHAVICMHMCAHIHAHTYSILKCTHVHALHRHMCTFTYIYTFMSPCADTLALREAHRAPETRGRLRQLTLLLLVSAGIQRRGRRG